jgi:hypothetical protein
VHAGAGRIWKSPIFAYTVVQPLRACFGGFKRQRLDGVRLEKFTRLFPLFGSLANARPSRDDEQSQMIAAAIRCRKDIVASDTAPGRVGARS